MESRWKKDSGRIRTYNHLVIAQHVELAMYLQLEVKSFYNIFVSRVLLKFEKMFARKWSIFIVYPNERVSKQQWEPQRVSLLLYVFCALAESLKPFLTKCQTQKSLVSFLYNESCRKSKSLFMKTDILNSAAIGAKLYQVNVYSKWSYLPAPSIAAEIEM